jgi:hypothetical protein
MKSIRVFGGMVILLFAGIVLAQGVPQLINYQGRLTDDTGMPIDGSREMRFRLLDADTLSASVLWSETHTSVQVDQGIYHVLLGSVNPLPPSAMSQADIFLEVRVAGEILRPRSQITSVPFAHKAASVPDSVITSAMIADGTITGSDINSQTITSSNISDETITSTQIQDSSITGADIGADELGSDQIQDIYVLNTGDTVTGDFQVNGHIGIGRTPDITRALHAAWSSDPADHYAWLSSQDYGVYARSGNSDETGTRQGGRFYAFSLDSAYGACGMAYGYGASPALGVRGYGLNESSGEAYGGYFFTSNSGTGTHYGVFASADDYAGWFQDGSVHIGNSGVQDYATSDGDLYVEDALEVDGDAHFSGDIDAPEAIDSSDLATGAVMANNIGVVCDIGEVLMMTASGWACGSPWFSNMWTWMSGSDVIDQHGVYGIKGTPDPANVPGSRYYAVSWIDDSGNLWLFGGYGYDATGSFGRLNDLWRWDGTYWTWMSGSDAIDQNGVYGTKGTPDPANVPGARSGAVSWTDASDNLWLFGGSGYDASSSGYLNDLWRWDGTNWTWMSGSDAIDQNGVYGTKGTPDPANVPGSRYDSVSWTEDSGNLWLFGGYGYPESGTYALLNDLWRWDGTNWTWMSGNTVTNQNGVYGTRGTPDPANVPGSRQRAVSWGYSTGKLWLFGGSGYGASGGSGYLNDLWKYK